MTRIRNLLNRFYWKMTDWIAPGLVNAQRKYLNTLSEHLAPGTRWLDLGCGCQVVPDWIPEADKIRSDLKDRCAWAVGIDCDQRSLAKNKMMPRRILGEVGRLPFEDGSFDLVTANMVVEHLEHPEQAIREVRRVLGPNGVFLFQTPNLLNPAVLIAMVLPQALKNLIVEFLQGRAHEDVFPTFYRMNRLGAIKRLAKQSGMAVHEVKLVESSAETVMLGPLVIFELLLIRLARLKTLRWLRGDIIAVLGRPQESASPAKRVQKPLRRDSVAAAAIYG